MYHKSIKVTFPVSDRSVEPTDVMLLFATVTLTKVSYCGNPLGSLVNLFPLRFIVSTGVVDETFLKMSDSAESPRL